MTTTELRSELRLMDEQEFLFESEGSMKVGEVIISYLNGLAQIIIPVPEDHMQAEQLLHELEESKFDIIQPLENILSRTFSEYTDRDPVSFIYMYDTNVNNGPVRIQIRVKDFVN